MILGHEWYKTQTKYLNAERTGGFSPDVPEINAFATMSGSNSYTTTYNVEGYFGSAQYNLAYCYWYGEGVAINKERAIELFKQSMAGGNVKAAQMMRILGRYDYVSQE